MERAAQASAAIPIISAREMNKMPEMEGVALRELLYSYSNGEELKKLVIRIKGHYLLRQQDVGYKIDEGVAACTIEFEGLDEDDIEVVGMDKLQALSMAVDIDPYLKGMQARYKFYWPTGDDYFE